MEEAMFGTFKTLIVGANARAEENLRAQYSIELIDQKIREAQGSLKAAKLTLASLIQRQRSEMRQIEALEDRVSDLTLRAREALGEDRDDLATEAACAIAEMENELTVRRETANRLEARVMQLRQSVETANRRILDLKQGAISARAIKREQGIQKRLNKTLGGGNAIDEAEELIANVINRDDPFEQSKILREIDTGLGHFDVADRLGDAGFGHKTRATADDILRRLQAK